MVELLMKEEVYQIIGAAMEVYNELGPGFLEPVYQESFEYELVTRGLPFNAQCPIRITYKSHPLTKEYCADVVCFDSVIVELKALDRLTGKEEAQLLNYLKATGKRVGVLINFGHPDKLEWKRLVR